MKLKLVLAIVTLPLKLILEKEDAKTVNGYHTLLEMYMTTNVFVEKTSDGILLH
jgi:hypothetical protein